MEQAVIVFTDLAMADLEDIDDYISIDSPAVAKKFISRILDKIEQLRYYPESGKFVAETHNTSVREILVNKYRIIYQLRHQTINIIRVVHGARLLDLDL